MRSRAGELSLHISNSRRGLGRDLWNVLARLVMNLKHLGGVWSCFLWVLSGKGRLVWVLVKSGLHKGGHGSPGPAFPWAEQNASGIRGLHFVSGSSIFSPLSSGLLVGFVCWVSWLPTASGLPGTIDQRMGSPALFLPQLPWRAATFADLWEHILHPSPAFTALLVLYHGESFQGQQSRVSSLLRCVP